MNITNNNLKHCKNLQMRKSKSGHWILEFESDIKWIQYTGAESCLCDCLAHEKRTYIFKIPKTKKFLEISLIAENKREDKELLNCIIWVYTQKYFTQIHLIRSGIDD